MAQTTTAGNGVAGEVEISANGTDWTNISGSVVGLDPGDAARQSGEAPTLDGDTMILSAGKREILDIQVRLLYTKTSGEAYETARAIFETVGSTCYLRWSPAGGNVGDQQMTTAKGVMTNFLYPKADAEDAAPIPGGFTVRTPAVATATIAS